MKKRGRQTGKERFTIYASVCGGGDLLKALGSVASYLADSIFYSTNDNVEREWWRKMVPRTTCNGSSIGPVPAGSMLKWMAGWAE